jgi:hypothetical protein
MAMSLSTIRYCEVNKNGSFAQFDVVETRTSERSI